MSVVEGKDARTEAKVDEVPGKPPCLYSQLLRYLSLPLRLSREPQLLG